MRDAAPTKKIELITRLRAQVIAELSPWRAQHVLRVVDLAARMCNIHSARLAEQGLDVHDGVIAALAHDLCKEMPIAEQEFRARQTDYFFYASAYKQSPQEIPAAAWHGPAAIQSLAELGFTKATVNEAVALHTVGAPQMGPLASIVYAADKLEPGRKYLPEGFTESCLKLDLDAMMEAVLKFSIKHLEDMQKTVSPYTTLLLTHYEQQVTQSMQVIQSTQVTQNTQCTQVTQGRHGA